MGSPEPEVDRLKIEVQAQQKAIKTKEACESILKFVLEKQDGDLLVNSSKENPYAQPPNAGQGCCIIS